MATVNGVPVECLSGELAGVWSGWKGLGDREIVREASAKGTHIDLAYKFLEIRRNCSTQEAKNYFNNSVEDWVNELLIKKQIHRASHILKNVSKIPVDYIRNFCLKCKEPDLRNYLAKHVESSFSAEEKEVWDMINLISKYEEKLNFKNNLISRMCLEDIINLPQSIKDSIYTEIYFNSYEAKIIAHLKSDIVWDYLLANNKFEFMKLWVDLSFGELENLVLPILEHECDIQLLFTNLKIKNSMIDSVESSNGMPIFNNLILSYLTRYGIFSTKESNSAKSILFRFFENCIHPIDFQNILSKPFCNVNKKNFFSKLDVIGFSRNYDEVNNLDTLNLKSKILYDSLKNMCTTTNDFKEFLELGIIETIKYLTGDINQYLMQNSIIAFALIFLNCFNDNDFNKVSLKQILNVNEGPTFKNLNLPKNLLDTVILNLPYLKNELFSKQIKNHINMYQLLDGYVNINSTLFFKWRFKNGKMPDFSSENLVKKFGHKEKLSYINYLKEARPNMAINILIQESSISGISSKTKSQVSLCAHVFALRHLHSIEIVSGCISFLEILGISSENLRLHITAAQFVQKELNVSIESSLESIIYNNQQELKLVLNYLERAFHPRFNIKLIEEYEEFIQALHIWTFIVKFAKAHNTTLPTSLPKFLASQDAWFQFILVGHLFSYPLNQLLECMQNFENSSLTEHLLCLNNTQLLKQNSTVNNKKSKIEKKRERKNSPQVVQDENYVKPNNSSQELTLPSCSTAIIDISTKTSSTYTSTNTTTFVDDLWLIILKCQQSQDPPGSMLKLSRTFKSPTLIVLATCFEPSPISSYCYSWLVISIESKNFITEYEDCLEKQIWTASKVLNLFQNMVARGFVSTLYRGLHIFLPENPLQLFFEFLSQCIEYGDFKNCLQQLSNFITECSKYKCNKMIDWDCDDATYLENLYWIQTVVVKCIIVTLGKTLRSTHTQVEFLEILVKVEFQEKLIVDAPNFETMLEYIQILSETAIKLDFFSFDTTEKIYEAEAEIEKCINELIKLEDYNNALRLTKAANFKASKIILAQYRSEFKKNTDKDGVVDSRFWSRCAADFEKFDVCYEKAAEFFVEHAEKVKSFKQRYEILKQALEILEKNSADRQICDTVEMAMWKSCILAGPESIEIKSQSTVFKKLKTELLSSCVSELRVTCSLTEADEKKAVENLIARLLDAGRLDTALRISAIFNHRNKDLQVLMLCLSLAEGEISPYQLTVQQRALLSDSNKPRERNSTLRSIELKRLPSVNTINCSLTSLNSSLEATNATHIVEQHERSDRLSLLTNLIEILRHGVDIGIRILLYYRLSVQIGKSYQILLTLNNPLNFLKEIVRSPYDRKLELARDIITTYQIENQEVANFLSEEIVAHITQVIEDGLNDSSAAWNYNLNLQSVIDLCKDSSLLGLKLLDMANKLLGHSNGEKRNLVTLKIIVELLIRSHDCFTASCNMEGIASVLRKCQQLANSLQNLKHWSLLVRLITGVGRFTEMNYIFKIMKENDQFEFLLGRGLDKVPGFRMALLDFLKRQCPEDKDLQNIVALHFRLYYEIAIMWKNEAQDVINGLINEAKKEFGQTAYNPLVEIKFTRNDSTEKRLQLALTNFTHATQYFLQDNKLNLANRCSHQAQLVALQISLLNSSSQSQVPIILNLSSDEINQAISRYLNFSQALIVARAYDHHVDWANAIYSHCILNGEVKYFKDFITSKRLTTSVAIDCGRRYRLEKNITKSMKENMQMLVESLNDNECKYVLASQMGFRKIIEEMLDNPAIGAYLKDTVFKRKYVAAEASGESFSKG